MTEEDAVNEVTLKLRGGFRVGDIVTPKHWFELDKSTRKAIRSERDEAAPWIGYFGEVIHIDRYEPYPIEVAFELRTQIFHSGELWLLDWE